MQMNMVRHTVNTIVRCGNEISETHLSMTILLDHLSIISFEEIASIPYSPLQPIQQLFKFNLLHYCSWEKQDYLVYRSKVSRIQIGGGGALESERLIDQRDDKMFQNDWAGLH